MHLQVVVQGDDGMQRTELYPANGPLTIGRHPQCSLRLDSDLVSRQHAVVSAGHGVLRVEDVSTNGTIAGDLLLRRDAVEVPYGTPIVVGDFTVFVYPADQNAMNAAMTGQRPAVQQTTVPPTRERLPQVSGPPQNGHGQQRSNPHAMTGANPILTPMTGMNPVATGINPVVTGMNPVISHVG